MARAAKKDVEEQEGGALRPELLASFVSKANLLKAEADGPRMELASHYKWGEDHTGYDRDVLKLIGKLSRMEPQNREWKIHNLNSAINGMYEKGGWEKQEDMFADRPETAPPAPPEDPTASNVRRLETGIKQLED